ncbi:MAG: hypothetical protein ACKVX9_07155 [Blastocatellia bacterium]
MNQLDKARLAARKERFLQDPLPVRLGNLASNLTRLRAFSTRPEMGDAAKRVLWESKHFTEWAGLAAEHPVQVELVELQRRLARWQLEWNAVWAYPESRAQFGEVARQWSERVLEFSGLLTEVRGQQA